MYKFTKYPLILVTRILDFLFPKSCVACCNLLSVNENQICTYCRNELPLLDSKVVTPQLLNQFFGEHSNIQQFSSLFNFEKDTEVQELIHNLKYRGHQKLGSLLGHWHYSFIKTDPFFKTVDIVIPVPIHKNRLRQRGYNQVALYAKTIAMYLQADYEDRILIKSKYIKSQVFLKRKERFTNILNSMEIKNSSKLENKHILLIDDIVTTGATIKACTRLLNKTNCKISVASIALAYGEGL